ncbi:relaxase/mobilization nuclease domain-containing protein [Bradyrhizobium sp.]|uniref:relaxase/mobilization nuclease domain-containing protein n=1 Tax=Bradyrhizobium sp. TaxID=376 RepID=UPI0039E55062
MLHDPNAKTNDRVDWIMLQNLHTDPDAAWFEMYETFRNQGQLKANAGLSARGRKNDKPVLHYTLAWHADDKPTSEQMKAAALDSLKLLGLDEHEALIVAHDDKSHPHVHIVANTIHPYTGRTAALKFSKERLSEWAENYERAQGRIHCEERVKNNEQRRKVREMRKKESVATRLLGAAGIEVKPAPFVPIKDKSPSRPHWFDRKDVVDRMKRLRAELDLKHKFERGVTWDRQIRERDALDQDTRAAIDNARAHNKRAYRPQWRELYKAQRREAHLVDRSATHPLERAVFVYKNRHRLAHAKPLTFRRMTRLIFSRKHLAKSLGQIHERERRELAREEKSAAKLLSDRIWVIHRERFHTLRDRQATEREAERSHQRLARKDVTFARAKDHLIDEMENPPPPRFVPTQKREQAEPTREFNDAATGAGQEQISRSEQIRRDMEAWRRQNPSPDLGREL